ncbi:MAG: adenylate/guanylate cyclase with integral rane sensor [Streptosporangiaceae bacterium]|nr:adenylate/guanylate cyclase with integral rane sensor [Streptosporangiaceae bacterium]
MTGRAVAQSLGAKAKRIGARMAGWPGVPQTVLELRVRWVLAFTVVVANAAGALVVLLFATFVIPDPPDIDTAHVRMVGFIAFFSYPLIAGPVALAWGLRLFRPVRQLVRDGGVPDDEQRHAVLYGPLRLTMVQGTLWLAGALGWAVINGFFSGLLALKTGLTCLLGAITTCAIVYLLAERLLRPAAALVLAVTPLDSHGRRPVSVTTRAMLGWALGTAIPILSLVCVAIAALAVPGMDTTQLAVAILGLGGIGLVVGFQVSYVGSRAIGDPIQSVREGMAQVERGDLDTEVEVYDASEVGLLQTGFNHMVAGLREHQRLRDLFGRHVGEDVAELALRHDIELGGETRDVAVLFVDLAGSTQLAETRPPGEVVALLNTFFGVVVDAVNHNHGWINKFEGDAALAVFGAPVELSDAGGSALAAARELAFRLRRDVPQVRAGIGVSAGPVVAGYIGAEQRFEYTVIGDPVNEAARLSDLAKASPDGVLASGRVLATALPDETQYWDLGKSVILRGRSKPTRLARPRVALPPATPAGIGPPRTPGRPRHGRWRLSLRRAIELGGGKPSVPGDPPPVTVPDQISRAASLSGPVSVWGPTPVSGSDGPGAAAGLGPDGPGSGAGPRPSTGPGEAHTTSGRRPRRPRLRLITLVTGVGAALGRPRDPEL